MEPTIVLLPYDSTEILRYELVVLFCNTTRKTYY